MGSQREQHGAEIWELRAKGWGFPEIADKIGIPASSTRRIWQEVRDEREGKETDWTDDDGGEEPPDGTEQFNFRIEGDKATAYSQGKSIRSLPQLLKAIEENGGDLEPWRVPRHVVNVWEMGRKNKVVDLRWDDGVATGFVKDTGGWTNKANWQVKAWFEPREEYPLEQAVDDILARMMGHAPQYDPPPPLFSNGAYLSVWNFYDAHFGKRSVDGAYTVRQAVSDYKHSVDGLAARVQSLNMPIRRILYPVGQDDLHADNMQGTTTRGTWVDMAADIREAIDGWTEAVVYGIERAAGIAPVDVVVLEPNHSRLGSYWSGKFLSGWFRNHQHVRVDDGKEPRKYYQFGRVLIGLDHGDKVKPQDLALKMAVEAPLMWSETEYREWLRGHLHTSQRMYYPATEQSGVNVRVIPALCPPDQYHLLHGYVGNHRAAEGIFYHADFGPAGTFPVFVDELAAT